MFFYDIINFKKNLGPDADKIMEFCLGENWKNKTIIQSREMFNKKLSLNLTGKDNMVDSALIIKDAYYSKNIGRSDLGPGPLTNLTDGGDGGTEYTLIKHISGVWSSGAKWMRDKIQGEKK